MQGIDQRLMRKRSTERPFLLVELCQWKSTIVITEMIIVAKKRWPMVAHQVRDHPVFIDLLGMGNALFSSMIRVASKLGQLR